MAASIRSVPLPALGASCLTYSAFGTLYCVISSCWQPRATSPTDKTSVTKYIRLLRISVLVEGRMHTHGIGSMPFGCTVIPGSQVASQECGNGWKQVTGGVGIRRTPEAERLVGGCNFHCL